MLECQMSIVQSKVRYVIPSMRIQVLHNESCNFWQIAKKELEEILKERGISVPIEEILIKTDAEAARYRFAGSPQILIDGKDIDPMAEKITNFHESGCRIYFWEGKVYEYPPREMTEEALTRYD